MAIFTTKKVIVSVLLFGLLPLTTQAANYQYMPNVKPENVLIRFQNEIIVDPTLSAGSVIKQTFGSFSSRNNKAFVTCQSNHVEYCWRNSQQYPIHNNEIHYPTNLSGVGLKIIYHDGNIQPNIALCYANIFLRGKILSNRSSINKDSPTG
ncbi:MAG: hypothetical protein AB8W37_10430 [Arsenophonus endosymbiont of Dermacentor nuttalli]